MADEEKGTDLADADAGETGTAENKERFRSRVETLGPCKVAISVEVPVETIREEIDSRYDEVIRTVPFPGFRVGHAPRKLVEKKLGDTVLEDVREILVTESFRAAMEEHSLSPISDPDTDVADIPLDPGKPFEYRVEVLVRPTVEVPDLDTIKVEPASAEVTDEMVDEAIRQLSLEHAVLEPVSGGVEKGDLVVLDFEIVDPEEGREKTVLTGENHEHPQDYAFLKGYPAPELPARLLGRGSGDEIEVSIPVPETWDDEEVAGKELTARIRILDVKRRIAPAIDEEFVRRLDFDSVEEYRDQVRQMVARRAEREAHEATDRRIVDALIEAAPFDLPEEIVRAEIQQRIRRIQAELRVRGADEGEIERVLAEARNSQRKEVERDFRATFLLDAIARKEKVFVTEEEVSEQVARMAASYGRPAQEMEAYLEQNDLLGSIRSNMRDAKVMRLLRKRLKIEDAN